MNRVQSGTVGILLKVTIVASALLLLIYYIATTNEFAYEKLSTIIERNENVQLAEESPMQVNPTGFNRTCKLPKLDPWDKSILKYFNSSANPWAGCKVKYEQRSFLSSSGRLWITEPKNETHRNLTENCFYRCKHQIHDYEQYMSNWTQIDKLKGAYPNCDIMDVYCWPTMDLTKNATYKFEHIQIVEKGPSPYKATKDAFDVHIILLDAASMSHVSRALPLTKHFIENELGAVVFPYLNKVGYNSRPNGYGFLLGEQPESMSFNWKTETGVENRGDVLCKESMNNKSVLSDYMYKGYRTFHFGDSANGVFIYPGCTGFTKNELDHSMRPFVLPFNGNRKYYDQELFDNVIKWQCKEHHEYVLGTLSKFMDLYRGQPKFSLNWLTYLNHDEMDDTFHADPFFRDWFNRNQKKFSNSFVFFMGDHGHNLDGILRSIIGKIENKNPFFSVILPEKLRSNKNLREQLKRNAEQLITHYDVYATFQEILLESYKWTEKTHFTDTPVYIHPTKKLLGSSLFHSLKQPRNCDALKIPLAYCMCEQPYELVNDTALNVKIAQMVVDKMNEDIKKSPHGDQCLVLAVDEDGISKLKMQVYEKDAEGKQLIRAELKVLPSEGLYDVFVEKKGDELKLLADKFPRIDRYAEQSKCLPAIFIRNYCYCKSVLMEVTKENLKKQKEQKDKKKNKT